ncbi:SAM hydroxide adenosyltransferase [Glaciecola petra]|uniref:SAM hydroxide adenosyltransferase n=1 Tax=Glaciecola petra TaxID=3075602 RepID=A0ABU2ZU37_9ALTE|nr:SAM hydroxide adenosyltransferase [Aestuariibacter sp. P117]MDT0596160.1 SAM hydroxide adenosyltransferase [Aestuariibacter sp. P117]
MISSYKLSFPLTVFILLFAFQIDASTRHTGMIEDSKFIVDVPENANGDVLFLARGYRPESLPLSAVYEEETVFFQTLLQEGWTIASPSFAGNRWIMADGVKDLIALRGHVNKNIINIKRAFIYAETMGGGITALLAEQSPQGFDGAISLGAHHYEEPQWQVPDNPKIASYLPGNPKFPILLMSNDGEASSSRMYVEHAKKAKYPPVLWTVSRPGHVNLNSAERLSALRALVKWAESGKRPQAKAALQIMKPVSRAAFKASYAAGQVTRTRPLYGNIYTNFVMADLTKLGIQLGDKFTFIHKNNAVGITFVKAYSDVPLGEWLAFIDPESYVQVSRNYENAAATFHVKKGDAIMIENTND